MDRHREVPGANRPHHQVGKGSLFPGAVATTLGLIGLRFFSRIVFSPLIASSAVTYGPFGTVLVLQSWLVGAGFVVYSGALVGCFYHEHRTGRRLKS
ncbi:hypothetical protein QR77_36685 [Streptomyces sp. 150FB]|nr:hypothetical protein QR77_36685 [Streptomyces sp. 150FB]